MSFCTCQLHCYCLLSSFCSVSRIGQRQPAACARCFLRCWGRCLPYRCFDDNIAGLCSYASDAQKSIPGLSFPTLSPSPSLASPAPRLISRSGCNVTLGATVDYCQMSWNGLSNEGGVMLGMMLHTNRGLTTLDLSSNRMGPEAAFVMAEALKRNPTLETLNVADNPLGARGSLRPNSGWYRAVLARWHKDARRCCDEAIVMLTTRILIVYYKRINNSCKACGKFGEMFQPRGLAPTW